MGDKTQTHKYSLKDAKMHVRIHLNQIKILNLEEVEGGQMFVLFSRYLLDFRVMYYRTHTAGFNHTGR